MLVLSRKTDQAIVIQGGIVVKILEVSGERVKLGISAPREVSILREELCEEVRRENLEAAVKSDNAVSVLPSLKKALVGI
jgi:carbon storage regulator